MIVSDYFKINNKIILKLKKYIKKNPCCNTTFCNHPKYQSDTNVFNIKDKEIDNIKNNYFNFIFKTYNKKISDIIENKCWAFITYKNKKINSSWHTHKVEKDTINISGILYLTNTNLGTIFKTKFINFEINPHINRWFIWDSSILHTPKEGFVKKDRLILAVTTVLNN
jgi:hypothetical protein